MDYHTENGKLSSLRTAAEAAIKKMHWPAELRGSELESILQELQVHQIELEMQNDELLVANEQVQIQRLKFENIYDLAPVGYFILGDRGIIEEVNTAGMALLESKKADLRGKNLQHFVVSEQADELYRFYRLASTSTERQHCQLRFRSKTGREFHGLLGARRAVEAKCYVALIDVTETIESRQQLAETNDRLQLALDASDAGTWELSVPSMRFTLDDRNQELCNAKAGGFVNTYESFLALVDPADRFNVDQQFRTAINTEREIDLVTRFTNTAGKLCYASLRGHPVAIEASAEVHFTGVIWNITEKKKQEELLERQEEEQRTAITAAALLAEERERKRISEALHDSVSQLLYGIKIQLSQLDAQNVDESKKKLDELLKMAIHETRNISYELAPPTLADFGLGPTIKEICERLSSPQMKITSVISGVDKQNNLAFNTAIYRIVQELINNAMKHSGADRVQIELQWGEGLEIIAKDNGKGFDATQQQKKPHGTGLASIRTRVNIYNGSLDIKSRPGKGTTIHIHLTI